MKMRVDGRALTRLLLSLVTVVFLVNAKGRAVRHPSPLDAPPRDAFTFSEPWDVRVHHLALDLTVDFNQTRLSGTATLDIENLKGTRTLILDTENMTVTRVTRDGGSPAAFSLGTGTDFGAPLTIAIEPTTRSVTIEYTTASNASGLHWNTAAQSFGRERPYLYTQNEPISARSWIPVQDTPAVRMTYEATIRVPSDLLALMSAEDNPRARNTTGVYEFTMSQTIPAYLIALAVGRLEHHPFDERLGVYAEPELIDDAAWELQYLPSMMAAAERILGPHPFPRHDVLLMPPTYVVGGMEHPMLNFVSPFGTVNQNHPAHPEPRNLIAHELAHSWSGDATTLGSWSDVWLNEGITTYLTQRIIEEMGYGERAEYQFYVDRRGYESFTSTVQEVEATTMHRELEDPNEGFSITSYTKGGLFLHTLEDLLGRTTLDRFLRDYFRSFSFRWVDDRNFLSRLTATLGRIPDASLRLNEWIYGTMLPSNVTAPTSSAAASRMQALANAFNGGTPIAELDPQSWSDFELDLFLNALNPLIVPSRMSEIDAALGLSFRTAPPLTWLRYAINTHYTPADPAIQRMLMRGGSNGTIVTIYSWLIPINRARAQQIFNAARPRYHPGVVAAVEHLFQNASANITRAA
jgi:leukotriene-A4 hydrolase